MKYSIDPKISESNEFDDIALNTYRLILSIPQINEMFRLEKHGRFLMHLNGHHARIMNRNLLRSGDEMKEGPEDYYSLFGTDVAIFLQPTGCRTKFD